MYINIALVNMLYMVNMYMLIALRCIPWRLRVQLSCRVVSCHGLALRSAVSCRVVRTSVPGSCQEDAARSWQ